MRRLALLAIVLGCGASGAALAQEAPAVTAQALNQAAFASPGVAAPASDFDTTGLVQWRSNAFAVSHGAGGAVDSVNLSVGRLNLGPNGLPMALYGQALDERSYQVTMTRRWPALVSFGAGRFNVDVTPHAGVGVDSYGGSSATAGAEVGLTRDKGELAAERLRALGVKDGAAFGSQGRWYLFAAASGRAVGLNMLHNDGGWSRAGWSTDPTSRLIGDQQLGVGWVKGPLQTSLGYVHRDMKSDFLMHGVDPRSDSLVALSFAIRRR